MKTVIEDLIDGNATEVVSLLRHAVNLGGSIQNMKDHVKDMASTATEADKACDALHYMTREDKIRLQWQIVDA